MSTAPTQQFLNKSQVEILFQGIAINILGYQPTPADGYSKVRVSWPTEGQPDWTPQDDVLFVRATWSDDSYDRVREVTDYVNPDDNTSVTQATTYTRIWKIGFVFYGPNSLDKTRQIISALFTQETHDSLSAMNLYMITDIPTPQRVPEEFTSQWWERVDFTVDFNEAVIEIATVPTIESVDVNIYNRTSPALDEPLAEVEVTAGE